jgi:uncharacterized protein YgbK (DUF1537 family)
MTAGWLIIADDLTGAADCGIEFAKRGVQAVVTWNRDVGDAQVLSIDAGTRGLPAEQAARRQAEVMASHYSPGRQIYKKIDSTLRGQPAAELAALLRFEPAYSNSGRRLAIVAPAFPGTGRETINGHVWMQGVPLEKTPLWERDHTYENANLSDMLASAHLTSEVLPLDKIAAGPQAIAGFLLKARQCGLHAVVCDAKSQSDLAAVAAGSITMSDDVIWVGSAGLASALASVQCGPPKAASVPAATGRKNVLIVVGTLAEASRLQARTLVENGSVHHVVVSPDALLAGPNAPEWQERARELSQHLAAERDVLLEISISDHPDLSRGPMLAEQLAHLIAPEHGKFESVIATGGDTVYALLEKLGAHSIRLIDEVEPGVPLGVTDGDVSIRVITKAGAFGDAHTLKRSLERLHRGN